MVNVCSWRQRSMTTVHYVSKFPQCPILSALAPSTCSYRRIAGGKTTACLGDGGEFCQTNASLERNPQRSVHSALSSLSVWYWPRSGAGLGVGVHGQPRQRPPSPSEFASLTSCEILDSKLSSRCAQRHHAFHPGDAVLTTCLHFTDTDIFSTARSAQGLLSHTRSSKCIG